jgi:hypothetical protein
MKRGDPIAVAIGIIIGASAAQAATYWILMLLKTQSH